MKRRRIDSVLLGGAAALSDAVNRRISEVDRRVQERTDEVDRRAQERTAELATARTAPPPAPAPAASPSIPGMPLPTGYGLQVRGPMGESIVLPVCLPPGFELDSMMLCPEFLPRVEARAPAPAAAPLRTASPAPAPAPHAPSVAPARPAAPPARPARPEAHPSAGRLDGVLQLVFGADQRFSSTIDHAEDALSSEPARGSPAAPESARR